MKKIRPRFVAKFLAWLLGYFWLPCPLCGEYFSGFEIGPASMFVSTNKYGVRRVVCSDHAKKEDE